MRLTPLFPAISSDLNLKGGTFVRSRPGNAEKKSWIEGGSDRGIAVHFLALLRHGHPLLNLGFLSPAQAMSSVILMPK